MHDHKTYMYMATKIVSMQEPIITDTNFEMPLSPCKPAARNEIAVVILSKFIFLVSVIEHPVASYYNYISKRQ